MSPKLAQELINNPKLLALIKTIPGGFGGNALASGSGIGGGSKPSVGNPTSNGPGGVNINTSGQRTATKKPSPGGSRGRDRDRETTPTPSTSNGNKPLGPLADGCFNCGTLETSMWRVKTYQDGTKKKVCDGECCHTSLPLCTVAGEQGGASAKTNVRMWSVLQQEQTDET